MSFKGGNRGPRTVLPTGLDFADLGAEQEVRLKFPIDGPLNAREQEGARQYVALRQALQLGPFSTGSEASEAQLDGISRYSDRYRPKQGVRRLVADHPYATDLFPEELYSVMGVGAAARGKLVAKRQFKADGGLREFAVVEVAGDEADDADDAREEPEEDVDDEFEEDEDNDYNAEQYFDGGSDYGDDDDGDGEAAF